MTERPEPKATDAAAAPAPARKPPTLKLQETPGGVLSVDVSDGDWVGLTRAAGSSRLAMHIAMQAATMGSHGRRVDAKASNAALAFVDAMKPRDAAELALLTQMAAIHDATLMLARRLNLVETIPQQDAAERALNKLARTYAAQMEALKRYRSKGQQVVRVERVTVQDGGQAIVGHVRHGGGEGGGGGGRT